MSWKLILKGIIGKLLLSFIFITSMSMYFLLYPLLNDPDYYKNIILENVYKSTGLQINYSESDPIVFPFPGIGFQNVTVSKDNHELIKVQDLRIEIYYGVFFGQSLQIRKVSLHTGSLEVVREKDESFPILEKLLGEKNPAKNQSSERITIKKEVTQTIGEKSLEEVSPILFSQIFANLATGIEIKNFTVLFNDKLLSRVVKLYFWESHLYVDRELHDLDFYLYGKLNEDPIQLNTNVLFTSDEISYENLRVEGELYMEDLHGNDLKDILVIFPHGDFRQARANGKITFYKRDSDNFSVFVDRLNIRDLAIKGQPAFGNAYVSVKITYFYKDHKLGFDNILIDWKGSARVYGSGFVNFIPPPLSPTISFEVRSDYVDLELAKRVVSIWLDPDLELSLLTRGMEDTAYGDRMHVYLNLDLKQPKLKSTLLDRMVANFHYSKSVLNIKKLQFNAFDGVCNSSGFFKFGKLPTIELQSQIENMDISTLLVTQFQSSPIAGKLSSEMEIKSFGNHEDDFLNNLNIRGKVFATNGQLLSYTNILKPISSIGSIINLKKVDFSRSTPYNTLNFDFVYNLENIEIQNFSLKADGIAGSGAGKIGTNKKIDMKFTIAMPGIAGKALKLPIIYKGTYGSTAPYIDPIWLGSVYAGTLFLASPAGAAVGGIAGSAMSDYVDRAVDTVSGTVNSSWTAMKTGWKSVFGADEESNSDPIKKNEKNKDQ